MQGKVGSTVKDGLERQNVAFEKNKPLVVVLCDVRVRAMYVCSGRLSVVESQKFHSAVLKGLCLVILMGQVEHGDLTGQTCVSLGVYTCI